MGIAKHSRRSAFFLALCLGLGLLVGYGCDDEGQSKPSAEPPSEVQELEERMQEAISRAEEVKAELRAMSVPELAQSLRQDSEDGKEPFNSLAYLESIRRGPKLAEDLAPLIDSSDANQLLALLAVRSLSAEAYESIRPQQRVSILVSALAKSESFNMWGLPHLYWEDAAQAVIAEGRAATEPLAKLLNDRRPAPVWGSEEYLEYEAYGYRVCDYAFALLLEIQQEKVDLPIDPAERDRLIAEYLGAE